MGEKRTLLVVGETALALGVAAAPGFFFLILMPGTGAELRASRKPVHSMAAVGTRQTRGQATAVQRQIRQTDGRNSRWGGMILTLISLAELDGVLRGLYFFSRCGTSMGPELVEDEKQPLMRLNSGGGQ